MSKIWPSMVPNEEYELDFVLKKTGSTKGNEIAFVKEKITYQLLASFLVSLAIGLWYFMTKVGFHYYLVNFDFIHNLFFSFLALGRQQYIWLGFCRERHWVSSVK